MLSVSLSGFIEWSCFIADSRNLIASSGCSVSSGFAMLNCSIASRARASKRPSIFACSMISASCFFMWSFRCALSAKRQRIVSLLFVCLVSINRLSLWR